MTADLPCRPTRRTRGERAPGQCDPRVLFSPRPTADRALPALLAPPNRAGRPNTGRSATAASRCHAATPTGRSTTDAQDSW